MCYSLQDTDSDDLCLASNKHFQSYEANEEGVCLKTEKSTYLIINNVTESDAGSYSCSAITLIDLEAMEYEKIVTETMQVIPGKFFYYCEMCI